MMIGIIKQCAAPRSSPPSLKTNARPRSSGSCALAIWTDCPVTGGPGQVLADMITSGVIPVVRLTEVFRQAAKSSPGGGEKMSKHTVRGGDVAGLLKRFAQLREKALGRTGKVFPLIVIQEAGLDGF